MPKYFFFLFNQTNRLKLRVILNASYYFLPGMLFSFFFLTRQTCIYKFIFFLALFSFGLKKHLSQLRLVKTHPKLNIRVRFRPTLKMKMGLMFHLRSHLKKKNKIHVFLIWKCFFECFFFPIAQIIIRSFKVLLEKFRISLNSFIR